MPLYNILLLSTLALAFFIPVGDAFNVGGLGSTVKLIGYLNLITFIILASNNKHFYAPKILIPASLFVLWNILTVLWSYDPGASMVRIGTYLQLLILMVTMYNSVNSENNLTLVLWSYVLGSSTSSMVLLFNFLRSSPENNTTARYSYEGFDPNDFALFSLVGLYFLLLIPVKSRYLHLVKYSIVILLSVAIVLSGSRAIALALIPYIVAFLISEFSFGRIKSFMTVTVLSGMFFYLSRYIPEGTLFRLSNIGWELQTGTLASRRQIWTDGIDIFVNNFLIGIGSGGFRSAIADAGGIDNVAHNTYLSIAAETGIVGLVIFIAIQFFLLHTIVKLEKFERYSLILMMFSITIGISSLTWEYRKPYWMFIIVVMLISKFRRFKKDVNPSGSGLLGGKV